jgi:type VI secretion system VgrG family protein
LRFSPAPGTIVPMDDRASQTRLDPVQIELWCPNGPELPWQVISLRGSEAISTPYELECELVCDDPLADIESALGADAELLLERNGLTRAFYGVIIEVEVELGPALPDHEGVRARVKLAPAFRLLDQEVDTRFFAGQSVIEILREQLGAALGQYGRALDVESRISGTYNQRDYCVQFRESTFDFCSRLLEEEGIAYVFVADPESQREIMVLVDNNEAYPKAELLVAEPLAIVSHQADELDHESIQRLEWRNRKTPNRVVTRGFNYKQPARADEGEAEVFDRHNPRVRALHLEGERRQIIDDPVNDAEAQSFTGVELDQRASQARLTLQRHQLEGTLGRGSCNAISFAAGTSFELADAGRVVSETELLLVRVVHQAKRADGAHSSDHVYGNHFECIPRSQVFRPARRTAKPRVYGVQTGVAVGGALDEIHTDTLGRVRVRFHADRLATNDDHRSCWIRVAQAWAGPGYGSMVIPRVGMEVVVAFVDGNPDCPLITGCVYDGVNTPPRPLPAELSRSTFKSSSTPGGEGASELMIEDAKGREQLYVQAQRRMDLRVRGTLYETVLGNREEHIGPAEENSTEIGDYNSLVRHNVNQRLEGDRFVFMRGADNYVATKLLQRLRTHKIFIEEDASLNASRLVVEVSDLSSHKAKEIELAGSSVMTLKAGSLLVLESNDKIDLKVGESLISIGPDGIDIVASKIRLNSGGQVSSASDGVPFEAFDITYPIFAAQADDGRPGGGGGGGGGPRDRAYQLVYRTNTVIGVAPNHAPPMDPPKKAKKSEPSEAYKTLGRKLIGIAWGDAEVWCSESTKLLGTFNRSGTRLIGIISVKDGDDGAELGAASHDIGTDMTFAVPVTIKDVVAREIDGAYEGQRDLVASLGDAQTKIPLRLRFLSDLPPMRHDANSARFNVWMKGGRVVVGGAIEYTLGWIYYIIALGDTVSSDTKGVIGGKYYGHEKSWYCKKRAGSKGAEGLVYWNGETWVAVPNSWTDDLGTKLSGMAVWRENGVVKTQFGKQPWPQPDTVKDWTPAQRSKVTDRLWELEYDIMDLWAEAFDVKRDGCLSADPRCCRHPVDCDVKFVEVAVKRKGIILAQNFARANESAWPFETDARTAAHEFGHHLGNPDEYPGAGTVDASVNTDGAVAGIDKKGLMGSGWTIRRRYFDDICTALSKNVARETDKTFRFSPVERVES